MHSINIYLFTLINNLAGKNVILDKIMVFVACYSIFIIPLFLVYLFFIKGRKRDALVIFASILISLAIAKLIELIYFHPRPFMVGIGKKLIQHSPETSFPSEHATATFATSFSLFFLGKNKDGIFFFILSFFIGLTRVACGVHFPSDIVGSFFVSLLGVCITYIIFMKKDIPLS